MNFSNLDLAAYLPTNFSQSDLDGQRNHFYAKIKLGAGDYVDP